MRTWGPFWAFAGPSLLHPPGAQVLLVIPDFGGNFSTWRLISLRLEPKDDADASPFLEGKRLARGRVFSHFHELITFARFLTILQLEPDKQTKIIRLCHALLGCKGKTYCLFEAIAFSVFSWFVQEEASYLQYKPDNGGEGGLRQKERASRLFLVLFWVNPILFKGYALTKAPYPCARAASRKPHLFWNPL